MKKFIIKVLIFLLPFGALISPFIYVAEKSMEICDLDKVIDIQNNSEDMLLGMGYNEQTKYYKYRNANSFKAEVISLGTSRVMQFKAPYFSTDFYNCGGAVGSNYNEYLEFLENLEPEALPEYLILGLDSWVFNEKWSGTYHPLSKREVSKVSIVKRIADDYFSHKWTLKQFLTGYDNIGFNGIIKGNGFRKDGSYYYMDTYLYPEKQNDYCFKDTFSRIRQGSARFEYGESVSQDTVQYLEKLLEFCSQREIFVIAFITPYAPSVVKKMEETGGYSYLNKIAPALQGMFDRYGYELYDFTNIKQLGCDNSYFVDGFHGGDVAYGMLIREMCQKNSRIKKVVNEDMLRKMLDGKFSNLLFDAPDVS